MIPIIHQRPEPICETLALLYLSENLEALIGLMKAVIHSENGGGDAFYHAHEALHRRYLTAFQKREVQGESYGFFTREMSIGDYLIAMLPFLLDQDLPYDAQEREEAELRRLLEESYQFLYRNGGVLLGEQIEQTGCVHFADYIENGLGGEALRAVAEQPVHYLAALARLIRANVPAMEAAWALVRGEAQPFIDSSWSSAEEFFQKGIVERGAKIRHIYPQLSIYTTSFFLGDAYYYGMFNVDTRPEELREDEKLFLTDACRALGDSTRMEILLLLRQRPWYNRELAQALGLTPATIMHHTDILLQNGLASMTTDRENQKRIYFSLAPERLEKMRAALARLFDIKTEHD